MRLWSEHVVPRVTDLALGTADVRAVRARAVERARGEVVELGFGSGPTLPLYPAAVTSVRAVEPSAVARRLGARRMAATLPHATVHVVPGAGHSVHLEQPVAFLAVLRDWLAAGPG